MQATYKQTAIKAAKEAGKVQLKYFGNIKKVKYKDKTNAVTNADLESEKKILNLIRKNFPEHSILSEEKGVVDNKSRYRWLIDPLDGTHNYMHNIPLFGVSIALEYRKEVVLGVIYLPCFDSLYVAEKGRGAFLNGRRIKVSSMKELRKAMLLMDGGFHRETRKRLKLVNRLSKKIHKIRAFGCAVIDFLYVAEGKVEGSVLFPTNPWDIAAGVLMVKEAGGMVSDFKGMEGNQYSQYLVVSNGKIGKQLLGIVNKK